MCPEPTLIEASVGGEGGWRSISQAVTLGVGQRGQKPPERSLSWRTRSANCARLDFVAFRKRPGAEDCVDLVPHLGACPRSVSALHEDFVVVGVPMAD